MIKRILQSSLGRTAAIYTGSNVLNAAVPFLMLPVLTRYLTPVDYGIVAMFNVLVGVTAPFAGLSVHGAINRYYFDRERLDFPRFVANCILILAAGTIIVSLVLLFSAGYVSRITGFPASWLWAVPAVSFFRFFTLIVLALWQVRMMALRFGLYQILLTSFNLGISIWLVVGLGMDWRGRIEGELAALAVFAVAGFVVLSRGGWLRYEFDPGYIRRALRFGLPLIPHTLGMWAITMIDRVFITNMVGISATGVYTVGYQIGMIIAIVQESFNRAWAPWLFGKLENGEPGIKTTIVKITYLYFVLIIAAALLLSLAAPWFLSFFVGKDFASSSRYVLWIALGYAFNGMYKMVTNYIFYAKKTHLLAVVTFLTALVNIILNYILISWKGAIGAAQATTLAFLFSFLFTWFVSARVYEMPWRLKR